MQNSGNQIYFNFSYYALKLLGKGLYSNLWSAIAELVANGIDAQAREVRLFIDMREKSNATIEILDNGYGMNYIDISEKYVYVGKNKREDSNLDEIQKETVMGRKGIGKLAALYLTNKYYLVSKTMQEETSWVLDMTHVDDSSVPSLNRINNDEFQSECDVIWESFNTGTLIKLTNVDLTNFGERSLAGLKARLADYFLVNNVNTTISVAVRNNIDTAEFEPVTKSIAYKNFYACFNNVGNEIAQHLAKSVYIRSGVPEISEKPRPVQIIPFDSILDVSGYKSFKLENGELSEEIPYSMIGWIGIHTSIDKADAQRNDDTFMRNKVYRPNQLRLYVRNKLAVENFLDYIKNTQAFCNYIEGEISFNLLDDNRFGDIATSNRQAFIQDDERVQLLVDILRPIITKLIKHRVELASIVHDDEKAYHNEQNRKESEAKERAEQEQAKAEEAKNEAESAKKRAEEEKEKYMEQNSTIFSAINEDQESFSTKIHLVKTNALAIKNNISYLVKKKNITEYPQIAAIAISADRILSSLRYSALAKFNIEDEFIKEDIIDFSKQFLTNVLAKQYPSLAFCITTDGKKTIRFSPQNIALIFDNLVSNSKKSNSLKVSVTMEASDELVTIVYFDDGIGFAHEIDINKIFEFGWSNFGGTGIGLYNIKKVTEKMRGSIEATRNLPKGAKFIIKLK